MMSELGQMSQLHGIGCAAPLVYDFASEWKRILRDKCSFEGFERDCLMNLRGRKSEELYSES